MQKSRLFIVALAVASWCWVAGFPQNARGDDTNREIAKTFANFFIQKGVFDRAQDSLMDQLGTDREDASSWNLLGLTYLEANQTATAVRAFEKATASADPADPYRGVFLYNQADALARSGNEKAARKILLQAAEYPSVSASANSALESLKAFQALPPIQYSIDANQTAATEVQAKRKKKAPSKTYVDLYLGAGYDTNVTALADSLVAVSASDTASPQFSLTGVLDHRRELAGFKMESGVTGALSYYTDAAAKNYNAIYAAANADMGDALFGAENWFYSFGDQVDTTFLNLSGFGLYNWTNSVRLRTTWRHSASSRTAFEIPLKYQKYSQTASTERGGWGIKPSVSHRMLLGSFDVRGAVEFERYLAIGAEFNAYALTVPIAASRRVFWNLIATADASFMRTWYPQNALGRLDTIAQAGLSFAKQLGDNLNASLGYDFKKDFSNVLTYKYTKHTVTLLFNYGLL